MDYFSGLTLELREIITGYVSHPEDLKSLCLTSRSLRESTIPRLYYRYELDIDKVQIDGQFFKPGQAIHEHIRQLIIKRNVRDTDILEHTSQTVLEPSIQQLDIREDLQEKIRSVLRLLPLHKLILLHTPKDLLLTAETLKVILMRQRGLRHLDLGPVDCASLPFTQTFESLVSVEVPQRSEIDQDLEFYARLLSTHPTIKRLAIGANRHGRDLSSSPSNEQYYGTRDYRSLSCVFRHFRKTGGQAFKPLGLDALRLCYQRLLWADYNLTPKVAFETLRELQLHGCRDTQGLLSSLAKRFRLTGSALKVFSLWGEDQEIERPESEAVKSFLNSFQGLGYL